MRTKYQYMPWPLNLYSSILQRPVSAEELPADWEAALDRAFSTLGREDRKEYLSFYFHHKVPMEYIAKMYNTTEASVAYVVRGAILLLRHPTRIYYLTCTAEQNSLPFATKPIDVLTLSVRSYNCLRRAGISTIAQLLQYTEQELLEICNLGAKSVEEIKTELALHNLCLRNECEKREEKKKEIEKDKEKEEQKANSLEKPIEFLELNTRTYNKLRTLKIETIDQLVRHTENSLLDLQGVGPGMVREIQEKLNYFGLSLCAKKKEEKKEEEKIPENAINTLGLTNRVYNCLRRAGIETVDQLIVYTEQELLGIPGMGDRMLPEVEEKLAANGLILKEGESEEKEERAG